MQLDLRVLCRPVLSAHGGQMYVSSQISTGQYHSEWPGGRSGGSTYGFDLLALPSG